MPSEATDMLVRLYDLPDNDSRTAGLAAAGVSVRRAMHIDRDRIVEYVSQHFSPGWRSECQAAFSRQPASMFIAVKDREIIGFACYDCTAKGMFGPTGCDGNTPRRRHRYRTVTPVPLFHAGRRICLRGDRLGIRRRSLYTKTVGAEPIPHSHPGIYRE
jgi:hypothetical protein